MDGWTNLFGIAEHGDTNSTGSSDFNDSLSPLVSTNSLGAERGREHFRHNTRSDGRRNSWRHGDGYRYRHRSLADNAEQWTGTLRFSDHFRGTVFDRGCAVRLQALQTCGFKY